MTTDPTPAIPRPDPAQEPGTIGADGGTSITGAVHDAPEHDDDSANGSRNLNQRTGPQPDHGGDASNHGSR